jgi:hypothetical protein
MRTDQHLRVFTMGNLFALWLVMISGSAIAGSPPDGTPSGKASSPNAEILGKYLRDCAGKPGDDGNCDKLRNDAVEILKKHLHTLGSTASRTYLPVILRMSWSEEPDLRIAVADAVGMIGPQDQDVDVLAPLTNDPVPDVRHAVSNMLRQGKGKDLNLLKERTYPMRTGGVPEKPADAAKFSMPVAPDSVYLFDTSDATKGRLSYVAKEKSDPGQFFKSKAKKGPYKWSEFQEQYRYQLQDEQAALDQAQQAAGKQLENEKPPDPTNLQAFTDYMQRMQAVSMQGSMGKMYFDTYQANLYGAPTVYVLEERQIGQRSYPTRYVVVYQELAFKRPGYRLNWTTVPDDALKAAQVASLKEQREEEALKATIKREDEAAKKREAELDALTKKKDAAEKKQFKKGQEDLEKALGF